MVLYQLNLIRPDKAAEQLFDKIVINIHDVSITKVEDALGLDRLLSNVTAGFTTLAVLLHTTAIFHPAL